MLNSRVANRMHVPGDSSYKGKRQFIYPQKKVMSLLRCAGPPSQRVHIFKQRPRSHLHPTPSTIKHSLHECLGKTFPNYRGVCHSSWKWNASQLQTTTESISELICCDEASVHLDNVMHAKSGEVSIQLNTKNTTRKNVGNHTSNKINRFNGNGIIRTLYVDSRFNFCVLKRKQSIPKSSTWPPMDFCKKSIFWTRASQNSCFAENAPESWEEINECMSEWVSHRFRPGRYILGKRTRNAIEGKKM